jgi:hypothetical protein
MIAQVISSRALVAEEALVLAEHWRPDLVVGRTVAWLVAALRPHW